MTIGTAGVPLFMPPGGLSSAPYGTIFGKPVIEIEQASALGTVGDILFADLSQYLIIEKGGINAARSVEVRFLYDEQTFKWTMRNNGMPIWKSALTPYKGTATVSPFVALVTRS
jgi:HK97 family phage major capsid protein